VRQKEKGKGGGLRIGFRGRSRFSLFLLPFAFCLMAFAADARSPNSTPAWHAVLQNGFSIRHVRHEQVGDLTRLWISADPKSGYVDVPSSDIARYEQEEAVPAPPATLATPAPAKTLSVDQMVSDAGDKHRIDSDFLNSVIRAESGFNPHATSPKGARGLMQLMPFTAAELGVTNSYDPAANVDAGTRYLRSLLDLYHGDAARALAAYNAGPHRVRQYGGVPPYRETQVYVSRVIRDFNRRKLAAKKQATAKRRSTALVPGY
jgi:soluble lytic murein transglycosylase-like protein